MDGIHQEIFQFLSKGEDLGPTSPKEGQLLTHCLHAVVCVQTVPQRERCCNNTELNRQSSGAFECFT